MCSECHNGSASSARVYGIHARSEFSDSHQAAIYGRARKRTRAVIHGLESNLERGSSTFEAYAQYLLVLYRWQLRPQTDQLQGNRGCLLKDSNASTCLQILTSGFKIAEIFDYYNFSFDIIETECWTQRISKCINHPRFHPQNQYESVRRISLKLPEKTTIENKSYSKVTTCKYDKMCQS